MHNRRAVLFAVAELLVILLNGWIYLHNVLRVLCVMCSVC